MKAATGKLQKGERHEEFESRKNQRFANSGSIGIGDDSNDERYGIPPGITIGSGCYVGFTLIKGDYEY